MFTTSCAFAQLHGVCYTNAQLLREEEVVALVSSIYHHDYHLDQHCHNIYTYDNNTTTAATTTTTTIYSKYPTPFCRFTLSFLSIPLNGVINIILLLYPFVCRYLIKGTK